MLVDWLDKGIHWFADLWPQLHFFNMTYNVRGGIAILLVSLACGAVSSLVVGNRMAFFSTALTHSAFAGVALGLLIALASGVSTEEELYQWLTPTMIVFGVIVGLGIGYVRESTSLAGDTVIGVFNAGALGFGSILLNLEIVRRLPFFSAHHFLFGSVYSLSSQDLLNLMILVVLTFAALIWLYNEMVLSSFNPSLARSRGARTRLSNYIFIVVLAMCINLCLRTVGVLLVHALLIVPAATAANLCSNLRQFFWWTVILCVGVGIASQWISWQLFIHTSGGQSLSFGIGGVMVTICVVLFFCSMPIGAWLKRRRRPALQKS